MNTEVLTPLLTPQGIVVTPQTQEVQRHNQIHDLTPRPGSLEHVSQYQQTLNKFLKEHHLRGQFRLSELLLTPEQTLVFHSPTDMMAVLVEDDEGKIIIRHCPRLFKRMLDLQLKEYKEVEYVHPLGNGLFIVTFPMDAGPPAEEDERPLELLMSMIMEDETAPPQEPTFLIGDLNELQRLATQTPQFKSIQLTQAQFDELTARSSLLAQQYDGAQIPLSPALVAPEDETGNVISIEPFFASRKFYSTETFHMEDGTTRTRLINRGEINPDTQEIQEASCYVITTKISSELHVVVAKMRRTTGQADGYEETAYELPRGFSRKPIANSRFIYQIGAGESGIPGETLTKFQTNKSEKLSSDSTLEDVEVAYIEIRLPEGISFDLENKQQNEPLKNIEQLVPTWMKMSDALQAIKNGETFTDAFSIAMLAKWFFTHKILTLKGQDTSGHDVSQLAIAMEIVQDYRNGGSKLTIWRDDSSQFNQLSGPVNSNSGINRRWHHIGLAEQSNSYQVLAQAQKPWQEVSLPELVQGIIDLHWDNVTIAAAFKMLLQQGFLNEHLEKLSA